MTRCSMACTGVAVLKPLLMALGRGWYYTILGVWSGAFGSIAVFLIGRKGMQWRWKRFERHETSEELNLKNRILSLYVRAPGITDGPIF
jgi:hypothetical protein